MYDEALKTVKTVLLAVILLSMFKIYELGGYANPVTIAVLVIMFALWILFRIELNEEVSNETQGENNNKEVYTPPQSPSTHASRSSTPPRQSKPISLALADTSGKKEKRITKFRSLVKSKSKSPVRINKNK